MRNFHTTKKMTRFWGREWKLYDVKIIFAW